jgi:hypothetical protein
MSTATILGIYALIAVVLVVLRQLPGSVVSSIAFSWMGPIPSHGETWAKYQVRWAVYSLDWLIQIVALFAIVNGALWLIPKSQEIQLIWAFQFALAIGLAMAVVAFVAFLVKAAKAHYIGPNPTFEPQANEGTTIDG